MPYFVYILFSEKDKKLYVGCTSNIEERLERHNKGDVKSTSKRIPFVLMHKETFKNKADAFNRERFLKSLWGSREKKKFLDEYINKIRYDSK
ncbi:MAG: GIY-YIG nuclease family protein [Candidatus Paceibacterota bacterium]|jgi:putative endonuclease